jgi:hypothetical protein
LVDLAIIGLAAIFLYAASGWKLEARLYPWIVGASTLVLAVIHLVRTGGRGHEAVGTPRRVVSDPEVTTVGDASLRAFGVFAWGLGLLGAVWLLGFGVGVPLFLLLHLKAQSGEQWALSVTLAAAGGVTFWYVFDRLLHLPFPDGLLWTWLEPR